MQMQTSINNATLLCLEPNGETYHKYDAALKLNYDHYKKVMEAKKQVPFIEPTCNRNFALLKEGDYVCIQTSKNFSTFRRPLYGWIKKDESNKLYILSFKMVSGKMTRGDEHTFIPEKMYLFSRVDGEQNNSFVEYQIIFSRV